MTERRRFGDKRRRTALGLAVVALSLAVAVVLAGISLAAGGGTVAANQYPPGKITICHHTKSLKNPVVTIRISERAWPAHKAHNDTLGPCTPSEIRKAKKAAHAKLVKLQKAKAKAKARAHARGKSQSTPTPNANANPNAGTHGNAGGNGRGRGK